MITLPADPEEIARRFFDNAKPQPDRAAEESEPYEIRKGSRKRGD